MSSDLSILFANNLKRIRQQRGLSQEALALMCNIDRTYIGRIESLKRTPSLDIVSKICAGLKLGVRDLLE